MIISDFECQGCGGIFEELINSGDWHSNCPKCGEMSNRIITVGRVYMGNSDGSWAVDSANALLDIDVSRMSNDPLERALATNPTRENLRRYMRSRGLRIAENEKGAPPVYKRPDPPDLSRISDQLYHRLRDRRSVTLRTR